MQDLTKGNPLRLIINFALPVCLGNIFQLFYSLADTRIVGSFLGDDALAAVGATSSLNNMIIGFLLGMTNGFAIIVARSFGARNDEKLKKSVAAAFVLGIITAAIFTFVSVFWLKGILRLINTPDNLIESSADYFRIILLGMMFAMLYNVCSGLLRAIGDSVTPLIFLVISTILNVFLDIFFVGPCHMGVKGAAIATVIAQTLSFVACFIYLWKKYPILHFSRKHMRLQKHTVKELLTTGLSMGFMNSLINIGSVFLQGAINSLGNDNYIVAQTAARKITEIFMMPFSVFGTTMATYCGQNLGANKPERIRKGVWTCMFITWIWCAFMILLSYTVVPYMVHLITATNKKDIIDNASLYLRIDTLLYFIPAYICIVRNALQGIGDTVTPIISSSMELICKVVVAVKFAAVFGYMAIIWAEPIAWIIMVVPLIIKSVNSPIMYKEKKVQKV